MRFLFNDVLFDIGEPRARLAEIGCPIGPAGLEAMRPGELVALVQDVVYASPRIARERQAKAMALSCMINIKMRANAMLCVRPPKARKPQDLPVRLAHMSLTVLGDLIRRDTEGCLTIEAIDNAVWAAV